MVRIPAILDCSCLIGLERVGLLDMLPRLLDPIFAPPAVVGEFGSLPGWLTEQAPLDLGMVAALNLMVDPGEAEAIALAYEMKHRLILDDLKAREAAQRLGIAMTGTVGLLLKAKQAGIIPALRPVLDSLDSNRFRISSSLRAEALLLAGE